MSTDVVLVPSTLALLPEYAGARDPIPDLRSACQDAVAWLVSRHASSVRVVAAPLRAEEVARGVTSPAGERIARHLLVAAGFDGRVDDAGDGVLVVANGTAKRTERAPGHLDDRARRFDAVIEEALRSGDAAALRGLDAEPAEELWARDWAALRVLGELLPGCPMELDYSDDPYGVQYWVGRATCGS
ncbi:MAG TPA: hypothetical protein VFG72_01645 [Marmoricola sp.]|nr:hypothetical protein [Marmoricola sp.]